MDPEGTVEVIRNMRNSERGPEGIRWNARVKKTGNEPSSNWQHIIASQDLHVNTGSILHLSLYNPAQAKPHKSHDRAPGAYSQTHRQAASPNER